MKLFQLHQNLIHDFHPFQAQKMLWLNFWMSSLYSHIVYLPVLFWCNIVLTCTHVLLLLTCILLTKYKRRENGFDEWTHYRFSHFDPFLSPYTYIHNIRISIFSISCAVLFLPIYCSVNMFRIIGAQITNLFRLSHQWLILNQIIYGLGLLYNSRICIHVWIYTCFLFALCLLLNIFLPTWIVCLMFDNPHMLLSFTCSIRYQNIKRKNSKKM